MRTRSGVVELALGPARLSTLGLPVGGSKNRPKAVLHAARFPSYRSPFVSVCIRTGMVELANSQIHGALFEWACCGGAATQAAQPTAHHGLIGPNRFRHHEFA